MLESHASLKIGEGSLSMLDSNCFSCCAAELRASGLRHKSCTGSKLSKPDFAFSYVITRIRLSTESLRTALVYPLPTRTQQSKPKLRTFLSINTRTLPPVPGEKPTGGTAPILQDLNYLRQNCATKSTNKTLSRRELVLTRSQKASKHPQRVPVVRAYENSRQPLPLYRTESHSTCKSLANIFCEV
jgi:hypothetical protein